MIRFDSIKILAPLESVTDFNTNHFKEDIQTFNGTETRNTLTAQNLDFGFNRLQIDYKANNLIIECSAKALKNDYPEGININTYGQLIDRLNDTKVVLLNPNVIYNEGKLLRCDVTDNVNFTEYKGTNFYTDMGAIPLPNKYDITSYNRTKNKGLVIKGKQKSFKERLIFYDKMTELLSNKNGREFVNSISKLSIWEKFNGTIRTETNLNQLSTIRKYVGSTNLAEALSSESKVNYNLFKKITSQADTEVLQIFDKYEGMKLSAIIDYVGRTGIIKDSNYNWQFLEQYLKKKVPGNYRRELQKFKKVYNDMKVKDSLSESTIITMFLNALKNVA